MPQKLAKTELFAEWASGNLVIADQGFSTGKRIFVQATDGTDAGGYGYAPGAPVATIDYAIALCTADDDDVIYVMPGHAETIEAAAAIVFDIEGVSVIGLGNGDNRPTVTLDTDANADIDVDADNVTIKNIRFINTMDACVAPLDINAAHCTIENCDFEDAGADNTLDWIVADAAADWLRVINCRNYGTDTAGNDSFISFSGAAHHVEVRGCWSHGDFAKANVELLAAITDCLIADNYLENANAVDVNLEGYAAYTGWVANNKMRIVTDAVGTWINTVGNACYFENYGVNTNGETGILIGTASASA